MIGSQRSQVGAVVSAPIGTPGAGSRGTPAAVWTGRGTKGPEMAEQNCGVLVQGGADRCTGTDPVGVPGVVAEWTDGRVPEDQVGVGDVRV